jgi:hypothetical protein
MSGRAREVVVRTPSPLPLCGNAIVPSPHRGEGTRGDADIRSPAESARIEGTLSDDV